MSLKKFRIFKPKVDQKMINVTFKNNNEFLVLDIVENTTFDEISNAIKDHYCHAKKYVLWNVGLTSISNLTNEELFQISVISEEHACHEKTAYVGSADLEFGLLNMYRNFAEISRIKPYPKVFKDVQRATEWLYIGHLSAC